MGNSKLKKGFTRIPNELLAHYLLAARNLSPNEHAMWWYIVKRIYMFAGEGMRWLTISSSGFEQYTGIPKASLSRIKKKLLSKNMIVVRNKEIGVQDNCELWKRK